MGIIKNSSICKVKASLTSNTGFLITIFIMVFSVFNLLTSCNKKNTDENTDKLYIGKWEMKDIHSDNIIFTLCLYEDHSFTLSAPKAVPQSGLWTVDLDTLKLSGETNLFSGRTTDSYDMKFKIVRINNKNLFLGDFQTKQVMELEKDHE